MDIAVGFGGHGYEMFTRFSPTGRGVCSWWKRTAETARRFKVGEASVYRWLKPGGLTYQRPGPRRPRKLDREQ